MTTLTTQQIFRQNYAVDHQIQGITRPRHWLLDHPPARDLFLMKIAMDVFENGTVEARDSPQFDELMDHLINSYGLRNLTKPSDEVEHLRTNLKLLWMQIKTVLRLM